MEAGYDYLLTRNRTQRQRPNSTVGIFLFIFGITLLVLAVGYYGYMATGISA